VSSFTPSGSYKQPRIIEPIAYHLAAKELNITLRQLDYLIASQQILLFDYSTDVFA
jgi:hypothetical protein